MSILKKMCAFAILGTSPGFAQLKPACSSHFYNKSNFQWSIYNFDGRKTWLRISPNSTNTIPWGNTTTITISGEIPGKSYLQSFTVQMMGSCPAIVPAGDSNSVNLNSPKSGDITTCVGGC